MRNHRKSWRQSLAPPLFSPTGLLCRAAWIAILFGVCHLAGLREYTSFLSGTAGEGNASLTRSAILGVTYMAAYYAFVLVAPILLIASAMLAGLTKAVALRGARRDN